MLPDSHAKSFLSKSYVNAIATQAGYGCQFTEPDYGIDAMVSEVRLLENGKFVNSGYHYNVQIKASYDYDKHENEIIYALKPEAYERLLVHEGGLIVLVLFCLPKSPSDRITLNEDHLELRNCCYWYRVTNQDRPTLHIPRSQLFDPKACTDLMSCAKKRDWK